MLGLLELVLDECLRWNRSLRHSADVYSIESSFILRYTPIGLIVERFEGAIWRAHTFIFGLDGLERLGSRRLFDLTVAWWTKVMSAERSRRDDLTDVGV